MNGYSLAETLRGQLQGPSAPAERDIETITGEIIKAQRVGGEAILTIGRNLIEAKSVLDHGQWLPWLADKVGYSERTAQSFMRLARKYENPQLVADLGMRKALALLALPDSDRGEFLRENHLVDGEEKSVIDMTSRELDKAIRERDEARKAAETAKADMESAEASRAKMEQDFAVLENLQRAAVESEAQARQELEAVRAELRELQDRPVDVAVQTVVDQEAVEQARAEAIAEMQAKLDKAQAAAKAAEEKRKTAERKLEEAKKQAGANAEILSRAEKAERELAEARRQLDAAAKAADSAMVNQNGDLAMFNVLFTQTQEQINKMHGLRMKLGKADEALDGKLKGAINALAEAVRRCAE